MNQDYTYQPDSIKDLPSLDGFSSQFERQESQADYSELSLLQDTTFSKREAGTESNMPVPQVRKTLRQRTQHIPVKGDHYLESRKEVDLIASLSTAQGLHLPERPVNTTSYDWLTLLLLISVALFASVRTSWNKYLNSLLHSTVNYSTALRMFQEKNNSLLQGAFQLDVLFYIVFSVFAFQVLNFFTDGLPYQNYYMYLFCLAAIVLYFAVKKTIYRFMGSVIEKRSETREYLFNADNFKRVAGLILLPMVAIIAYYPYGNERFPVFAGVAVIVLLYSLLVLRGFIILIRKQFSIFYLFLYFCTLEFLPLVLLYKILVV